MVQESFSRINSFFALVDNRTSSIGNFSTQQSISGCSFMAWVSFKAFGGFCGKSKIILSLCFLATRVPPRVSNSMDVASFPENL